MRLLQERSKRTLSLCTTSHLFDSRQQESFIKIYDAGTKLSTRQQFITDTSTAARYVEIRQFSGPFKIHGHHQKLFHFMILYPPQNHPALSLLPPRSHNGNLSIQQVPQSTGLPNAQNIKGGNEEGLIPENPSEKGFLAK